MARRQASSPRAKPHKTRAQRIYRKLLKAYPDARCALHHRNPYELLVATILSAQCTDERVNRTTPALFKRYPTPDDLAAADQAEVEQMVRSCGFYRNKARSIRMAARAITDAFGGEVPWTMQQLLTLPGVARKTANVILGTAYGIEEGIVVDTHVRRLALRMGFTAHRDPPRIERDLMELFPRAQWTMLAHLLIWHGRRVCSARKPDCPACPVASDCPRVSVACPDDAC